MFAGNRVIMARSLKQVFVLTNLEWLYVVLTATVSGLILSFRKWGGATFDLNAGIENLLVSTIFCILILLVFIFAQKWYSFRKSFEATYKLNHYGITIELFLTVLTDGYLFLLAPGLVFMVADTRRRLGKWRYRPYFQEYGYGAQHGIYALLLLVGLFGGFNPHLSFEFARINRLLCDLSRRTKSSERSFYACRY